MKQTIKMKIYSSLALAAMVGSASATTVLIDFGRSANAAASPYNSVVMLSGVTGNVALLDTASAATGWTISVTEDGNGNGGSAGAGADVTSFPAALSAFDAAALGDSLFANQGNPQVASMTMLLTGLSTTSTYDILLYGSRANGQGIDQRWSLTEGTGGADVDHFSELNATDFVDWSAIAPNASGEIEVTINSPGPDTAGALALNFGSITENPVPEPSGTSLLGLGLAALSLRRKRA